ncbi:MAG: DUF748 domain-containing protein [Candidatus Omnitrophota bacterium]|nr:DUF748 domain-containing protein [Candidatus Omnitrophota bacterium]
MKHLFKKSIYLAVIFIIALGLIFGYNYAARNLKSFVISTLENSFGARLSIAHMRVSFPLCLELKGVKINDTISVSKVYVYPSPESAFLKKTFIFSSIKLVDPVVKIKSGENYNFADMGALKNNSFQAYSKDSKAVFYISRINIENGTFIYVPGDKNKAEVVLINGNIKSLSIYLLGRRPFSFELAGFIKNQNSDVLSPLRIEGLITRDFVVKAKLQAQDVALETLGGLHEKYLKGRITEGKLNLDSKILISKNDLKADCFCRINDIILKDAVQKLSMPLIASFILGFDFKDREVKIENLQTNLLSLFFNRS